MASSNADDNMDSMPDWQYARLGISLLLNNQAERAERMFQKRPDSTQVKAAYSFLLFMNALMSFEEEKLQLALAELKDTERRCANESYKHNTGGGWFKSVKDRLMSSNDRSNSGAGRKSILELQKERSDELERRVISADCQLCGSLLTLLQQDLAGYMKGAWALRRAWKAYRSTHSQILRLYRDAFRDDGESAGSVGPVSPVNGNWEPSTPATPGGTSAYTPLVEVALVPDQNPDLSNGEHDARRSSVSSSSSSSSGESFESCASKKSDSRTQLNQEKDKESRKSGSAGRDGMSLSFTGTDNEIGEAEAAPVATTAAKEEFGNNGYIKNHPKSSINDTERPRSLHWASDLNAHQEALRWASDNDVRRIRDFPSPYLKFYGTDQQRVLDEAGRGEEAAKKFHIEPETLSRLMSAVSFGYGVFQLAVSLLPPSLLRVVHFLGFEGDRGAGLASLAFARQGCDMRAPLATLALLWYHTIVRPFFAIDGSGGAGGAEGMSSEIAEAAQLIEESKQEFSEAALFLFFEGRVERLKCDLPAAVLAYERSARAAVQQEIQLLCMHEIGWCRLMQRDFASAARCFEELRARSRWSRIFYTFVSGLCRGASGKEGDARAVKAELMEILSSSDHKEAQVEKYIGRRVSCFPDPLTSKPKTANEDQIFWRMYLYEMLILWNALQSCKPEEIEGIINECLEVKKEPVPGLSSLVLGACHAYFSRWPEAEQSYRLAIDQKPARINNAPAAAEDEADANVSTNCYAKWDDHIAAFAKYELAVVLMVQDLNKNREEAKRWLHEAQQYKDYDFENRLNVRIHAALKRASEGEAV